MYGSEKEDRQPEAREEDGIEMTGKRNTKLNPNPDSSCGSNERKVP